MVVVDLGCSSGPNTWRSSRRGGLRGARRHWQPAEKLLGTSGATGDPVVLEWPPRERLQLRFPVPGRVRAGEGWWGEGGICRSHTTWWECRAPSTAGCSHLGVSTSFHCSSRCQLALSGFPPLTHLNCRLFFHLDSNTCIFIHVRKKRCQKSDDWPHLEALPGKNAPPRHQMIDAARECFNIWYHNVSIHRSILALLIPKCQVPQGLDTEWGVSLNKKKVYIAETSPPECHKSIYQDQFQREQVLETNWDPFDDSNDDSEFGSDLSGKIVARYVRAASQSQIAELLVLRGRHSWWVVLEICS